MTCLPQNDPAITIDEVGIATARHGDVVLRSAFQLVFRRVGDKLVACAAESFLRPFRKGLPLPPRPFLAALEPEDRYLVERRASAIHVRNHSHIGVDGLTHMMGVGPALVEAPEGAAVLADLSTFVGPMDEEPAPLVCSLRVNSGEGNAGLSVLAQDLKSRDIGLALGGPAEEAPLLDVIGLMRPDIVRIDGGWFRRVVENEVARRLMASLVAGFKSEGALVLVEGLETRDHLDAALEIKADLLQGFLLSPPRVAGTDFDGPDIALRDLFPPAATIIPLFGNGR